VDHHQGIVGWLLLLLCKDLDCAPPAKQVSRVWLAHTIMLAGWAALVDSRSERPDWPQGPQPSIIGDCPLREITFQGYSGYPVSTCPLLRDYGQQGYGKQGYGKQGYGKQGYGKQDLLYYDMGH
jgi:hypothetical protein